VISDKSQGSVAACLRCGGLFSYHLNYVFITKFGSKKYKLVNSWQSYRQKGCLMCPVRLVMSCLKMNN